MSGKLYVMGAPRYIFDGLHPELQQRIEYVSVFSISRKANGNRLPAIWW